MVLNVFIRENKSGTRLFHAAVKVIFMEWWWILSYQFPHLNSACAFIEALQHLFIPRPQESIHVSSRHVTNKLYLLQDHDKG